MKKPPISLRGFGTHQWRCERTYKIAITSIMIRPTATTEDRGLRTIAPQRGQALAVSAIMPPHVRHEVIRLILTSLPPCSGLR
jgi:hypothetical protein